MATRYIQPMTIEIPELALVVLIGPSGSGKTTFARRHFKPTEVLTSDFYRALVADDENDQAATAAAFEVLHMVAAKRLELGRLTVIDATNVQPESRSPLIELARTCRVPAVAIIFDLPERLCRERNKQRTDRRLRPDVIRQQQDWMRQSMQFLGNEGFENIHTLDSEEAVSAAVIEKRGSSGPTQ